MPNKNLSFQQFEIEHLDVVLPCLERVFRKNSIDFYILGGLARDINFLSEDVRVRRITKDLDVAVFIPEPALYREVMTELVKKEGFQRISGNPLRLLHLSGAIVDILPFDERTGSDASMARFGPAFADFNLQGLYEIFAHSTREHIIQGKHRYQVTTPEGIILLKFIAYNDKPERRLKDLEDIGQLLKHYFDLNDLDIYENHNDLFEDDEKLLEQVSARVIGRKIRDVLGTNKNMEAAFHGIIEQHIAAGEEGRVAIYLSNEMDVTPEVAIVLLKEIQMGLLEPKLGNG
ncbi:MAG TPA: hypothetical protein ENJ95_08910 [Bacteroidetes bacterium]|nr:hypothetical protein [Bacteroidota bacterium]